ncbi:MAG: MFS transporter [Chloroflexota bacterium]
MSNSRNSSSLGVRRIISRLMTPLLAAYPVVRNMRFMLLLAGNSVSAIGSSFNTLALSLLAFDITGSVAALANIWIARVVSRLVLQPFAGAYVDRWPYKSTLVVGHMLFAMTAVGFLFVNGETIWLAYVLTFCLQAIEGFVSPALNASLPSIVGEEELLSANALFATTSKTAVLIGPALAGLLYGLIGASPLFLFNAVSYLVVLLAILPLTITITRAAPTAQQSIFRDVVDGFRFAIRDTVVLSIIVMVAINSLALRVLDIVLVPVSESILNVGPQGLGLLYSSLTFGSLVGLLVIPYLRRVAGSVRWLIGTYTLIAVPFMLVAVLPVASIAYVSMFVIGVLVDISGIVMRQLVQTQVPPELRGRIFATLNMAMAAGVIPALLGLQPIVDQIGFMGSIGLSAVVIILAGLAMFGWIARPR